VKEIWERLPSEYSDPQERDFLAQHFGVDRLEMAIRASAGDDTQKDHLLKSLGACHQNIDRSLHLDFRPVHPFPEPLHRNGVALMPTLRPELVQYVGYISRWLMLIVISQACGPLWQ